MSDDISNISEYNSDRHQEILDSLGWGAEAPNMIADEAKANDLGEPVAVVFIFKDAVAQLNRHDITLEDREGVVRKLVQQTRENMATVEEHRLINAALS